MSRKHYIKVAAMLAGERAIYTSEQSVRVIDNITRSLADLFKQDNSNFDRQRFYTAAGLQEN